jgi:hypothetical protein
VPRLPLLWSGVVAATVAVGITAARSQQDLDAGKSGPQLFAQDCSTCHRSPQGLVKTMSGGSLVSFLRQHYTSSSTSANALAGYLLAAGGNPRVERPKGRPAGEQANQPVPARDRSKLARPGEPTAAVPSGDTPGAQAPAGRKQREKLARPTEPPTDHPSKASRKARRSGPVEPAEPVATPSPTEPTPAASTVQPPPPAEPVASIPAAGAGTASSGAAAGAGASAGAGAPQSNPASPPPPGFAEPLP